MQLWERWETLSEQAPPSAAPANPRWERSAELKGHTGAVTSVAWRADGALLASVDAAGQLMTWRRGEPTDQGLGAFEPFTTAEVGTTFWTCRFAAGRVPGMLAAGGFSGVPAVCALS